jgi:DNA polymerase-1
MGGTPYACTPAPLLLVDGHNLLWGATFGFPAEVRSRDKTRLLTGLFGFFALLRVAVRNDIPTGQPEIIVVFDGQYGAADRQQIDASYKAQRPTDAAALAPIQFLPDVRRGLDLCAVTWIEIDHAEADDVIATLVATTPPPREILLMSRDRDYYQLVDDRRVRILNTKMRPGSRLINATAVYDRHRVTPIQWPDFRSLTGDPADNIPGVRGIGAKTAAELLADGLTLEQLRESGRLTTRRAQGVLDQWDAVLKWRDMIRLRSDLPLPRFPTGQPTATLPTPRDVVDMLELW